MTQESTRVLFADPEEQLCKLRRGVGSGGDELGQLVGVLSAADFLCRDSPRGGDCEKHDLKQGSPDAAFTLDPPMDLVCRYMNSAIQTVSPQTPLLQAAKIMHADHIHHLPVVEGGRRRGCGRCECR
jgi:CBS domain-containing protein